MNHSNVKSTTKKRAKAVLSVFLVVAILIAGAYAFLSATDSKTNVFTVGNVKIELWEDFNGKTYNGQQTPDPVEDIIPGQTIDKKPYIKNKGNNNAWMFMAVGVPTASDEDIASNKFPNGVKIEVKAFGIQENYNNANTAVDTWKSYFTADKVASTLGTIATNAEKELFTLNEPANSGWTKLDDTYRVEGYVYYIFALDTVAAPATNESDGFTTAPFESVTFNVSVGTSDNSSTLINLIPENCILITTSGVTYNPGDIVPDDYSPTQGDVYKTADYTYAYNQKCDTKRNGHTFELEGFEWVDSSEVNGWGVRVNDDSKTSYENIQKSIYGQPVINLDNTFSNCTNLIVSPNIPEGVDQMNGTFSECAALKTAPQIPNTVSSMKSTFSDCTSLTETPYIPSSVKVGNYIFSGCTALVKISNIPSLDTLHATFQNCTALESVPEIPDCVTQMAYTFSGCTSLKVAPTIPQNVTYLMSTFEKCTSLTQIEINATSITGFRAFYDSGITETSQITGNITESAKQALLS